MTEQSIDRIYVEIDCLLDTRAGVLSKMVDDDELVKILSNTYHDREIDQFPVDMKVFSEMYANRDVDILQASTLTGMVPVLRHIAATLRQDQSTNRPGAGGVEIVVNTHPYVLSEEEASEIIKSIYVWMDGLASAISVSMPQEELTPHHCKNTYKIMFMYDGLAWMEAHAKGFEFAILPEVTLMTPRRFMERVPTSEELKTSCRVHPAQAIEMQASTLIDLKMIDMKYFCIVPPQPQ